MALLLYLLVQLLTNQTGLVSADGFNIERRLSSIELKQDYQSEKSKTLTSCYSCKATCKNTDIERCNEILSSDLDDTSQVKLDCVKDISCCEPNQIHNYIAYGLVSADIVEQFLKTETCDGLCETHIELKNGMKRDILRQCSSRPWGGEIGLSITGVDVFTKNIGNSDNPATVICRCRGQNCNSILNPNDCDLGGYSKYTQIMIVLNIILVIFIFISEILYKVGIVIEYSRRKINKNMKRQTKKLSRSMSKGMKTNLSKTFHPGHHKTFTVNGVNGQSGHHQISENQPLTENYQEAPPGFNTALRSQQGVIAHSPDNDYLHQKIPLNGNARNIESIHSDYSNTPGIDVNPTIGNRVLRDASLV